MNIPEQITITVIKPNEKDYHANKPERPCAPMAQGRGCYGDCFDCYSNDVENYARMLKKYVSEFKNFDTMEIYSLVSKPNSPL